ncbi:hypothetical protein FACS189418_8920 [Clostridia bacterium]|nr:hypothetical protein FACS189418_8920 [Clostridia bacterium]
MGDTLLKLETGIYLRVSTEEQAQEGFSIRAQEQKLKDYAQIKEWSIYKIYADEGISGKDICGRPAIKELINDIQTNLVKNVLVFKIDRLTRSTADLIYLVDLFNQYHCAFNSLMESIDTQTASGRMFLKIIGLFAEFERENMIERTRVGVERKVKEGYSLCASHASYGFNRPKNQKIQTINQKEAAIVQEIFEMYGERGFNLTDIARRLNLRGVKTKYGKTWDSTKIRRLIQNVNYIGNVRHHIRTENETTYDGLHEGFIEQKLFDRAQALLLTNKRNVAKRPPKDTNYFSGFLVCRLCGYRLKTYNTRKKLKTRYLYTSGYTCMNKTLKTCTCKSMSHKKVEKAFLQYLSQIADFNIDKNLDIQHQKPNKNNLLTTKTLKSKLKVFQVKEHESLNLYINNEISFAEYHKIKKQLDRNRLIISTEIERLEQEKININPNEIELDLNLQKNWNKLDYSERRRFLREFVQRIVISSITEEDGFFGVVDIAMVEFKCEKESSFFSST